MRAFAQRVKAKARLIDKHREELAQLLASCPHEEMEDRSDYTPGDYYDKGFTTYYRQCKVCHAVEIVKIKTHQHG